MLTNVKIENYRGFKSYRMESLARVNLLIGKNNCGKTALLEGIQFLASGGDPAVLAEAAERRGELVFLGPEGIPGRPGAATANTVTALIGIPGRPGSRSTVDIAHFFHGHSMVPDNTLSFVGSNDYPSVTMFTRVSENGESGSGGSRSERASAPGVFLEITISGSGKSGGHSFRISPAGGVNLEVSRRSPRIMEGAPSVREPQSYFVGPDSLNSIELAFMWDEATRNRQEVGIADAMRVLDPDLESLHFLVGMFVSGYFPSRGGIVVGVRGHASTVPLGSMGDGMRRLMALASALAFTRGSCLFVDEIDTGLHYSAMPDMWKLVVSTAAASNTQVFATTHSWDCIEGLSQLCQDEPNLVNEVAVHKINPALPHSVPFSGESLVRMLKSDIDPR